MGIILSLCNASAAYYANGEKRECSGSSGEDSWVEICKEVDDDDDDDDDLEKVVVGIRSSGDCSSAERAEKYVARRKVEKLRSEMIGLERKHFRSVHPMTMVERRMLKEKDFAAFRPFDRRKVLAALGEPASVPARAICQKEIALVNCDKDVEPPQQGETSKPVPVQDSHVKARETNVGEKVVVDTPVMPAPKPSDLYRKVKKSPARGNHGKIEPAKVVAKADATEVNAASSIKATIAEPANIEPTKAVKAELDATKKCLAPATENGLKSEKVLKTQELQIQKSSERELKKPPSKAKKDVKIDNLMVATTEVPVADHDRNWSRILKLLEKRVTRRTLPPLKRRKTPGSRRVGSISGGSTVFPSGKPASEPATTNLENESSKDGELENQEGVPVEKVKKKRAKKGRKSKIGAVGESGELNSPYVGEGIEPQGLQSEPTATEEETSTKKQKNPTNHPEVEDGRGEGDEQPKNAKKSRKKKSKKKVDVIEHESGKNQRELATGEHDGGEKEKKIKYSKNVQCSTAREPQESNLKEEDSSMQTTDQPSSSIILVVGNQSAVAAETSSQAEEPQKCLPLMLTSSEATESSIDPKGQTVEAKTSPNQPSVGETNVAETTTMKATCGSKAKGPSVKKMVKSVLRREVQLLSSHGRSIIVPDLGLETVPRCQTGTEEDRREYIYRLFEGKSMDKRGRVEVLSLDKDNHEDEQVVNWEFSPQRENNEPRPYEGATHGPSKWSKLKFWKNKTVVQQVGLECKKSCWDSEVAKKKKRVKGDKKSKKKEKVKKEDKVKAINITAPEPSTSRTPDDGTRSTGRTKPSDLYRKVGSLKPSDIYRKSPNTDEYKEHVSAPGTPDVETLKPSDRYRRALRPPTRAGNRAAQGLPTNIVSHAVNDSQAKEHRQRVDNVFANRETPNVASSRPTDLYRKVPSGSDNGSRTDHMSRAPRPSNLYRKAVK